MASPSSQPSDRGRSTADLTTESIGALSARVLFAHLQIRAPEARSILLATARSFETAKVVAEALAQAFYDAGEATHVVDLEQIGDLLTTAGLIASIEGPGRAIVYGGGIMDRPNAITAAVVADVVVVVATRGMTKRTDLSELRLELERVDARVVGAVMLT